MTPVAYTHSQLSSPSVARLAALNYDLPEAIVSKFYASGLHDNYLIEDERKRYILRIYRNDWRSPEEVAFELELLAFLGAKDAGVAHPLSTRTGELSFAIDCPEGERIATLFAYADGCAPGEKISTEQSSLLGKAVANIHRASERFKTDRVRRVLDVQYLLEESILAVRPFISVHEYAYLCTVQCALKERLPELPRETGTYGICIGDVNPNNFHINEAQELTLFDFDQCGYGYRAFELGKFFSSIHSIEKRQDVAAAFVEGYRNIRRLSEAELGAIPCFEIIAVIWVMAINVYNANRIGHKWLEQPFWNRKLARIRELERLLPTG